MRVPLDPYPALRLPLGLPEFPPLLIALAGAPGVLVDGRPARVVESADPARPCWLPGQAPLDVEFVAADVPAFGCRRIRLVAGTPACPASVDDGRAIETPAAGSRSPTTARSTSVSATPTYRGLLAVEDRGDRGDTYDFDPVPDDPGAALVAVSWRRWRHPSGLQGLVVERTFAVPRAARRRPRATRTATRSR